jgi:PAS domain S-box-containing protein
MAYHHALAERLPSVGFRLLRIGSTVAALPRSIVGALLPATRREGRVIGLVGVVIVLFIVAFTNLMLRELDDSSRASGQAHVEQLTRAVTYQLGTTLFMVENVMDQASEAVKAHSNIRGVQLNSEHQVATNLLADFLFLDPEGQVVTAMTKAEALANRDLSDREYFRVHVESRSLATRLHRPVHGRLTGIELFPVSRAVRQPNGELIGVLVAMIDIKGLERVWKDIGLTPTDTIVLIGEDGEEWLEWPHRPLVENPDEVSWSRRIAGWPMRALAKLDQASIDAQNAPTRRAIIGSAGVGAVMVALFAFLLANRARQADQERDAADAVRARLTAALNAVPVEFVEYDRERRLIMANQAARDASPWRVPGAARGKTVDEVMASYATHFATADNARAWKAWTEQTVADYDRGGVSESYRPDGQWRRSYVSDMPGGGRVVVRVDITDEKQREEQLAAEMERLNSVFQSTGAGIVLLDRDGRVILANQHTLDDFGKTASEMVGKTHAELGFKGITAVLPSWQAAVGPERLRTLVYDRSLVLANGSKRVIKVTTDPVQDEAGRLRYIVMIAVDDTDRREAEVRLFDTARIAHLGDMATGMAHELNQPLAVIRMSTEGLLEELDMPEAEAMPADMIDLFRGKLDKICKQVERATGLVKTLRSVAHKPADNPVPFDLVAAVRKGSDLLREQLRAARIDFELDLPDAGLTVKGDANQLQQVLINLVLNARDALVDDTGRPATGTLGRIAVSMAAAADGGMQLTVDDDGPGIPDTVMPRLFEPFFTTKPTGKGTGLGLSISHGIIKRMGGRIVAENRPEGGARFRIAFPSS